jgi:membrane protein
MLAKFKQFISHFREEYWDPQKTTKPKGFFNSFLRTLIASIRSFLDDNCFDKASTLTFYSLLSIIPLVAIGFGIAQELGFAEKFTEQVKDQFQSQPQVAEKIIQFSNATLKTTKGGVIAVFGIVVLLWTVLRMIGNIETFFDEIWKVKTTRTLWQQIKRYVPMIIFFPIFLVGSNSVILYASTEAILASQSIKLLSFLGPAIKFLFQIIPYILNWCLLSFLYIYLPNTKVSWKAGLVAGFAAGILYAIWQWIYVTFQVNASSYGAIYGSFAAVPLFLIWLNYSWLIILFGSELSHHIQETSVR